MSRAASTVTEGLKRVPPFPPVAAKLLTLLAKADVETSEVAQLIAGDATFTARILQRINSVEFGLVTPVTNVQQAVSLLGLDLTRKLVLTHATAAYAQGALKAEELRRCWQHTVATAVLADLIAKACGEYVDYAFTAGIMHDIGRLGLLVAYPNEYEQIIRDAAARCLDLLDFERDEFGMDHAEAGRILAERWGLPAGLAQVAGRHHDPCEGTTLNLLSIIHVACRLSDALGYDVVKPRVPLEMDAVLAELPGRGKVSLGKSPEQLRALIELALAEYGSEDGRIQPEEGLALLAAATAEDSAESTVSPDPEAAPVPEAAKSGKNWTPTVIAIVLTAILAVGLLVVITR
ncbi:MAG TPA: HDOD domain-containing protein [Bryobacteraceae bacterium]|nr:HDOD domain-containing protein [Bryobacteraceae bacterium]